MSSSQKKNHVRTISLYERCRSYYSIGYSFELIYQLVLHEFEELEPGTIDLKEIKGMYLANREEWEEARSEFAIEARRRCKEDSFALFIKGSDSQGRLIEVYLKKLTQLLDRFEKLDVIADREDFDRVYKMIEELNERISKISGVSLSHELEALKGKLSIQAHFNPDLNPMNQLPGGGMRNATPNGPAVTGSTPAWANPPKKKKPKQLKG